ncbi:MAG: hypothetical protein ABJ092_11140 [Gillisia sp.]
MAKPLKCIPVEEARKLQETWKSSRGKEIERAQKYVDTREFWYSLEELQEYLDYVKEKSAEEGVSNPGIRIYLGAYPGAAPRKSYSTVFLAPTKPLNSMESTGDTQENAGETQENNYSIDPLNHGQGGVPPLDY